LPPVLLSVAGEAANAPKALAELGEPMGGGGLTSGTVATVLHCGQLARLPAAAAGTFSVRPQPVQGNSMVLAAADPEPKEVVMIASCEEVARNEPLIILSGHAVRNWPSPAKWPECRWLHRRGQRLQCPAIEVCNWEILRCSKVKMA
jgi:hypothetical protein